MTNVNLTLSKFILPKLSVKQEVSKLLLYLSCYCYIIIKWILQHHHFQFLCNITDEFLIFEMLLDYMQRVFFWEDVVKQSVSRILWAHMKWKLSTVCVAGSLCVHHVSRRDPRLLHHAAHPEAQHDGVSCGRGLGEPPGAVLPAQPLFLHGDLWPAGSGRHKTASTVQTAIFTLSLSTGLFFFFYIFHSFWEAISFSAKLWKQHKK